MITAQLQAQRWQVWGAHAILLHNFEPTRRQLMWAAVLDAGWPAALASHSSLEVAGFKSFASEAEQIHLIVPRGAKVSEHPQITVHESRRVRPDFHVMDDGIPRTPTARSAIDAAAWQTWPRFACALLAAVVQQRLATVDELETTLELVGRVRHKRHLRDTVRDLRGGSQAISEVDLVRMCDRHGLVRPYQQARRRDQDGRWRFLDATWRLWDRRTVVLEVDGLHHLDVAQWQDDIQRERAIVLAGAQVLRATAIEVRTEPTRLVADLRTIGVPER